MQNILNSLSRFLVKLVLAVFGLVFAASFLLAASVAVLFSLLKSLVTWQKPAPFVVYSQFKQFRQGARSGRPVAEKSTRQGDVVDVEMRELKDSANDKQQP